MSSLTIYLSKRAPKTIVEEEWPILVSTPESNKAQDLIVRVQNSPEEGLRRAVVYGQKGAGIAQLPGAGLFSGIEVVGRGDLNEFQDMIASALFHVGCELGMDIKQVWPLVQQLAAGSL